MRKLIVLKIYNHIINSNYSPSIGKQLFKIMNKIDNDNIVYTYIFEKINSRKS